jgi:hypothetical protein
VVDRGVGDANATTLNPCDPPRGVAELEDVAGETLDREVFVNRAMKIWSGSRMTS